MKYKIVKLQISHVSGTYYQLRERHQTLDPIMMVPEGHGYPIYQEGIIFDFMCVLYVLDIASYGDSTHFVPKITVRNAKNSSWCSYYRLKKDEPKQ